MEDTKEYILQNVAPALGVMLVCILGSFFVYKSFYNGDYPSVIDLTQISPAAGEDVIYEGGNSYFVIDTGNIPVWSGIEEQ